MASEGAKLGECSRKIGVTVCTIRAGHALSRAAIQPSRTHGVPWKSGASAPRQVLQREPAFSPRGRFPPGWPIFRALCEEWDSTAPSL